MATRCSLTLREVIFEVIVEVVIEETNLNFSGAFVHCTDQNPE